MEGAYVGSTEFNTYKDKDQRWPLVVLATPKGSVPNLPRQTLVDNKFAIRYLFAIRNYTNLSEL